MDILFVKIDFVTDLVGKSMWNVLTVKHVFKFSIKLLNFVFFFFVATLALNIFLVCRSVLMLSRKKIKYK